MNPFCMKHGKYTQILIIQKTLSVKFPIIYNIFSNGAMNLMCPKLYQTVSEQQKFYHNISRKISNERHPLYYAVMIYTLYENILDK